MLFQHISRESSQFSTCFYPVLKSFVRIEFSVKSFLQASRECRKVGRGMPRDFYPFVEGAQEGEGAEPLTVTHPARIAVYDDTAAAPRVVVKS